MPGNVENIALIIPQRSCILSLGPPEFNLTLLNFILQGINKGLQDYSVVNSYPFVLYQIGSKISKEFIEFKNYTMLIKLD